MHFPLRHFTLLLLSRGFESRRLETYVNSPTTKNCCSSAFVHLLGGKKEGIGPLSFLSKLLVGIIIFDLWRECRRREKVQSFPFESCIWWRIHPLLLLRTTRPSSWMWEAKNTRLEVSFSIKEYLVDVHNEVIFSIRSTW